MRGRSSGSCAAGGALHGGLCLRCGRACLLASGVPAPPAVKTNHRSSPGAPIHPVVTPLSQTNQPRLVDSTGRPVGPPRVWLQSVWVPGLAMSRALGDQLAHHVGVSSRPDVVQLDLEPADRFLVLASDGVWEFMSSQEAVELVAGCGSAEDACRAVSDRLTVMGGWVACVDDRLLVWGLAVSICQQPLQPLQTTDRLHQLHQPSPVRPHPAHRRGNPPLASCGGWRGGRHHRCGGALHPPSRHQQYRSPSSSSQQHTQQQPRGGCSSSFRGGCCCWPSAVPDYRSAWCCCWKVAKGLHPCARAYICHMCSTFEVTEVTEHVARTG